MNKKLPLISSAKKICIICEGFEEHDYFTKLLELNVWNKLYDFKLVNAEGNGNIPARYQEKYQSDSYDLVLVFCDTDKNPREQYELIKKKINNFHGSDNASNHVVIFGNPCTLQIILLHFDDVKLVSHKKKKNSKPIELLTGILKYDAEAEQRKELCDKITKDNYSDMKNRVSILPSDDTIVSSSNIGVFLDWFGNHDTSWINRINDYLS